MNSSASCEIHPRHPLAGIEGWPLTGPVYGFAEEQDSPPARSFWAWIGERLRRWPDEFPSQPFNSRVWY